MGLLLVVWYTVRSVVVWYFDVMIVTTERLIDRHQWGLFRKRVQVIDWEAIHDVRYEQSGIWPSLLNYGTIILVRRDGDDSIELDHVARIKDVTQLLTKHAKTQQSNHGSASQSQE